MLRIAYAAVRTWSTHIYSSFPLSREGRGQRLFRFARDFAPADIAAAETAGEVELVDRGIGVRSEEHTSELQSLMRISYAVFCLKQKNLALQYQTTTADLSILL